LFFFFFFKKKKRRGEPPVQPMPIHLGQLPSVQLPMTNLSRLNRKLHDLLRKCNKCMDKLRDNALHHHPLRGAQINRFAHRSHRTDRLPSNAHAGSGAQNMVLEKRGHSQALSLDASRTWASRTDAVPARGGPRCLSKPGQ
jgi:hypothetical protein